MAKIVVRRLSSKTRLTLAQVAEVANAPQEFVRELYQEGIIEAERDPAGGLRFREVVIVRIKKAKTLHDDLGINLPGIALALDLLRDLKRL